MKVQHITSKIIYEASISLDDFKKYKEIAETGGKHKWVICQASKTQCALYFAISKLEAV